MRLTRPTLTRPTRVALAVGTTAALFTLIAEASVPFAVLTGIVVAVIGLLADDRW